ncbi:hypothetical protein RO575_00015 [Methylomonas sp. MO1]|uniref:hypothetical protein n=1 Tax=unclassified Methylomonas TaxID=2608980 RepID=UPI00047B53B5|nr:MULTISPECIES: hypothetical protein [unclassified Methylomonas]MDT4287936.1 hypothetical protein [Methylomonas sp. MO1]
MAFPHATRTSAFVAGLSLSAPLTLLAILNTSGLLGVGIADPQVVAFFVIYALLTGSVFVLDVRSFAPKQLKTRIPLVYFPTDQAGMDFLISVFGRILIWVAGVVAGVGMLVPLWYFLQKQ